MSLEECKGAVGAANPEAIAALLELGHGELAAALVVPEKDTQALIDLAKYQHQVLCEIAAMLDDSQGFAALMRENIRIKCRFVLRAAAKAGLMS